MTASVYQNLEQLTYRELLMALSNIKKNENKVKTNNTQECTYKDAIIIELANRQRDL